MTGNAEFEASVRRLQSAVLEAIAAHFKGEPYDQEAMLKETSIDFRQLALEAHFYGADVFPNLPDLPTEL